FSPAQSVYVKVVSSGAPVEGASVQLIAASNEEVAMQLTNATGEVSFSDKGRALQVKIAKEGFETTTRAIGSSLVISLRSVAGTQPTQPINHTGTLSSPRGTNNLGTLRGRVNLAGEAEQRGSFQVKIQEKDTGVMLNGTISLYDVETNSKMRDGNSVNGVALFENLVMNQHVYFAANIVGYSSNKTSDLAVTPDLQEIVIEAVKVPSANVTLSFISQLSQQKVTGVAFQVFDSQNVEMTNGTSPSSGNVTISLTIDKQYYVTSRKSGFLTNVSQLFSPVKVFPILLAPAAEENTSVLTARFVDEYNNNLDGIATLYTSDGRIIEQKTTKSSQQVFSNLQRNAVVEIRASSGDLTARKQVTLSEAQIETILQWEIRFAKFVLTALDVITNQPATGITVNVTRNGVSSQTCAVPCNVSVKTRGWYFVNFSSNLYFDYVFSFGTIGDEQRNVFEENSATEVNASMMPISAVQDSRVVINGVFDNVTFQQIPVNGVLKENHVYIASLSGFFVNAQQSHLFFTPANTTSKPTLFDFSPKPLAVNAPVGLTVRSSTSTSGGGCGNDLTGDSWKRLLMSIQRDSANAFSQSYAFYFVPEAPERSQDAYENLTLAYKSFIKRGSDFIRNPFDQNLPINELKYDKECDGNTLSSFYNVESPNEQRTDQGSLGINFRQDRVLSELETINKPEACGVLSEVNTADKFSTFDCNGFSVDSEFAKPLEVSAKLELNDPIRSAKVKFTSNPEYFTITGVAFKVGGQEFTIDPAPVGGVFEKDLPASYFGSDGKDEVEVKVNLSGRGASERSEITVKATGNFVNETLGDFTLEKSIPVSVNPVREIVSQSLLSGTPCGDQAFYNYSFDTRLRSGGKSGWIGCKEISLFVDPIFPADAVPVYISNATGPTDCAVDGRSDWDKIDELGQKDWTPAGRSDCFTFEKQTDSSLVPYKENHEAYLLKFNAAKCGGVVGNQVFVTNASLNLVCTMASDKITVNVTVHNSASVSSNNLQIKKLQDTYSANGVTYPLDPSLLVVIDNLQLHSRSNSETRLGFKTVQNDGQTYKIGFTDVPGQAFALAKQSHVMQLEILDSNLVVSETDVGVQPDALFDGTSWYSRPILSYIRDADELRRTTAFRRSGQSSYWCQETGPFTFDSGNCRPTLNDWMKTVPSTTTRTETCVPCQNGVTCDSTCDAATGQNADGTPCFNACRSPVCDPTPACNAQTKIKQVEVPGRSTQRWVNTTELVSVPLFTPRENEFTTDAPFKYFIGDSDTPVKEFKYTRVFNLINEFQCTDSIASVEDYSGPCFVNLNWKSVLENQYGLHLSYELSQDHFKITEAKGGCEYSKTWDRGYYVVTFTYYLDSASGLWKWKVNAQPLEISKSFIQISDNSNSCWLGNGDRRTKMCYFTFSTSIPHSATEPDRSPGYCVRSLRDYIPEQPTAENTPKSPSGVLLRDMALSQYGFSRNKCPLFNPSPIAFPTQYSIYCNGRSSDSEDNNLPCISRVSQDVDLNLATFGLTPSGKIDWVSKRSGQIGDWRHMPSFDISQGDYPVVGRTVVGDRAICMSGYSCDNGAFGGHVEGDCNLNKQEKVDTEATYFTTFTDIYLKDKEETKCHVYCDIR
ncbi:MAG: hypothetical protein V1722_03025, partial [Candidatus Micrarchaeota archaeon]